MHDETTPLHDEARRVTFEGEPDRRPDWTPRDEVVGLHLTAAFVYAIVGLLIAVTTAAECGPWPVVFYLGGVPMILGALAIARDVEARNGGRRHVMRGGVRRG